MSSIIESICDAVGSEKLTKFCNSKPGTSKLSSKLSRESLLLISCVATLAIFAVDSQFQEDPSLSSDFCFYALGLLAALAYVRFSAPKRVRVTEKEKGFKKVSSSPIGCGIKPQAQLSRQNSAQIANNDGPRMRRTPTTQWDEDGSEQKPDGGRQFMGGSVADIFDSSSTRSRQGTHEAISDDCTKAARLHALIGRAISTQGPAEAGRLVEQLEGQGWAMDTASYNAIIRAWAKQHDLRNAKDWFDRLRRSQLQPDENSFNAILSVSSKDNDAASVSTWMKLMSEAGVAASPATYNMLVHAFGRNGNVSQAANWMKRMQEEGLPVEGSNYNALIHACSTRGDGAGAKHWFDQMRSNDVHPTVTTFTSLIDVCSKTLDLKGAERCMEEMDRLSIAPNVVSYSTMINVCSKSGDLVRAEHWYAVMKEKGVVPNAYCFSALINACAKVGNVEAACSWLERAEELGKGLDGVVYGCVINACGKVGDAERAMCVFEQMRARGIQSHIVIYAALARPFAYRGDSDKVEEIAEMMALDGIVMNDYFLYTMLLAYSRSKPRQAKKAEMAFLQGLECGVQCNERIVKVLSSTVGRTRCAQLCRQVGYSGCGAGDGFGSTPTNHGQRGPTRSEDNFFD